MERSAANITASSKQTAGRVAELVRISGQIFQHTPGTYLGTQINILCRKFLGLFDFEKTGQNFLFRNLNVAGILEGIPLLNNRDLGGMANNKSTS